MHNIAKILLCVLVAGTFIGLLRNNQSSTKDAFSKWMSLHNKQYSANEKKYRESIFLSNLDVIERHNYNYSLGLTTFSMQANKFADLTLSQYINLYTTPFVKDNKNNVLTITGNCNSTVEDTPKPPDSVDWSPKAATEVQDQGQCGASWAFSATGALQGLAALQKGRLSKLSAQQLMDCTRDYGNEGCNGGFMDQAFWYVIDVAVTLDEQYPYVGSNNACVYKPSMKYFQIRSCAEVQTMNYTNMLSAVIQQPVSVAIDAASDDFRFYKTGVFDGTCGEDINRGATLVGYGKTTEGVEYWKLKHSIGSAWGMDGYMQLSRSASSDKAAGKCGVLLLGTVPKNIV